MTTVHPRPYEPTHSNGGQLRAMFAAGADLLERHVETINGLNVFPVPDGDTGTNMLLTLRHMLSAAEPGRASAGEAAAVMAKGALMGARGNSGVILSQFFRGFASQLEGHSNFGAGELAASFEAAREHSYKAVGEPVEGTMLTVISWAARAATQSAGTDGTLLGLMDRVCDASREAVELTPSLLPILSEAGVVDSGGLGLYLILEGARASLRNEEVDAKEVDLPTQASTAAQAGSGPGTVTGYFLDSVADEAYGYCTQFIVTGEKLDPDGLRLMMTSLASSTVVVGDESMVKVHVHVADPDRVLEIGSSLGSVSQIKIDDIDAQHERYADARRSESRPATLAGTAEVGVVSVAWGPGIEKIFVELGAVGIISGGDTMNPSVKQIVAAVESAGASAVILLPNNANIVPAAVQASSLCSKPVTVVPTTTIPQGIAAILAFGLEMSLEENQEAMRDMLPSVRSGEVSRAVRDARIGETAVRAGQAIGLLERELVAAGDDSTAVLLDILRHAEVLEGALVTLYWGGDLAEAAVDEVLRSVESNFPGVEIEVVYGGQPHYDYIVSIE